MRILTNHDIKSLFIKIICVFGVYIFLIEYCLYRSVQQFGFPIFFLSISVFIIIMIICYAYFYKYNKIMEKAISQINQYLLGNTDARIECDKEGELYKLFQSVNTLVAVLNGHAAEEKRVKEFLKNTISDIFHQLKTPLAALSIYNGLLQEEREDSEAVLEFTLRSEYELDRIEDMVQSLLKIAKLDSGSIVMEKSFEKIADMMNDVIQCFEIRANQEQKNILLNSQENIFLYCDRSWLIEAVSNIVKNSLDHTVAGDYVKIEWNQQPLVTQIIISDNGSGIHPEDIYHVFKRFYRSRFSKDKQGIGLGLSLAKTIIEAHGGTITVDSLLGEGSIFVMSFLNITNM